MGQPLSLSLKVTNTLIKEKRQESVCGPSVGKLHHGGAPLSGFQSLSDFRSWDCDLPWGQEVEQSQEAGSLSLT